MARPRQITDEQILTTMRSCVLEHGAQVSLDVVAHQLGVTAPALLKRFGTRQELLLRALRPPDVLPFVEKFRAGPDARRPLREQLGERFTDLWSFFEEMIPAITALRESGIPHEKMFDRKQRPQQSLEAITAWLKRADELGLADVPAAESVTTAILGAIQARVFFGHVSNLTYSARSTRAYLDDLVELFGRALAPKGRRSSRQEVA